MEEEAKSAREVVAALGELVKVIGDDSQAREAVRNLGTTAVTITRAINTVLLPVAAVNFAFARARDYFNGPFHQDVIDRTKDIPLGDVVEPKASIVGPALQGLAFAYDQASLKEMYLNLVATAMDGRVAESAHPAFVEVIKQLDGEEARLLRVVLRTEGALPCCQIRGATEPGLGASYRVFLSHVMRYEDQKTFEPREHPRQEAMIDNWIRLGLVEVNYDRQLVEPGLYDWVDKRPELKRFQALHEGMRVYGARGHLRRTAFGAQFGAAVGIKAEVLG